MFPDYVLNTLYRQEEFKSIAITCNLGPIYQQQKIFKTKTTTWCPNEFMLALQCLF